MHKDFIKNIVKFICVLVILVFIYGVFHRYIYIAAHSIITDDDFVHWTTQVSKLEKYDINNNFNNAVQYGIWDCLHLGGRYFTMFLQAFFSPRPNIDILLQEKFVMMANVILYFFSLFFLVFALVKNCFLYNKKIIDVILLSVIIYFSIIVLHNYYNFYYEVFTWFSGAMSYTVVLSFFFLSFANVLFYMRYKFFMFEILAIIFAILSMGGSISIIMLAFNIILIYFIYLLVTKKMNFSIFIMLLQYAIFASINVFSPGNFKRKNIMLINNDMEKIDVIKIAERINKYMTDRLNLLFDKPFFMLLMILFIIIIANYIIHKSQFDINIIKTICPIVVLPYLVTFSFALGYEDDLPLFNRCSFMIDFTLIIVFISIGVLVLCLLSLIFNNKKNIIIESISLMILLASVLFYMFDKNAKFDFYNIDYITISKDIKENKYENYYNDYCEFIKNLKNNEGKEISIVKKFEDTNLPKIIMRFNDNEYESIYQDGRYLDNFFNNKKIYYERKK